MATARHILIVNSRSVHQPLFVIGAPHSGAGLIGRALKASAGLHVTLGQPSVLRVVYAFARRPSMYRGRTQAAASVIRDALAQGWQVTPTAASIARASAARRPAWPPMPSARAWTCADLSDSGTRAPT